MTTPSCWSIYRNSSANSRRGQCHGSAAGRAGADLATLAKHVHQLKGSGGLYGFPQITEAAADAEHRVKEHEPLDAVRQGVEAVLS